MSKIIRMELSKSDMEAAVVAYIQPKINEVLKDEISRGSIIKISHKYIGFTVAEVSVDIDL